MPKSVKPLNLGNLFLSLASKDGFKANGVGEEEKIQPCIYPMPSERDYLKYNKEARKVKLLNDYPELALSFARVQGAYAMYRAYDNGKKKTFVEFARMPLTTAYFQEISDLAYDYELGEHDCSNLRFHLATLLSVQEDTLRKYTKLMVFRQERKKVEGSLR